MAEKKTGKIGLQNSLLFYCLMIAFPVLQFAVFYIGVNFNSIALAFKEINPNDYSQFTLTFSNFTRWFTDKNLLEELFLALGVSLKAYLISLIVGLPLGLFFSYYIFKKMPASEFFRVVLFLPSVISSIVLVQIYSYFTDEIVSPLLWDMGLLKKGYGLLSSSYTRFGAMMAYNVFVSFGTSVLMYSNKMSTISPEVIESASLDGATPLEEFFHIVLPMSFPTISVFLVTGVAGIFTNQINHFAFSTNPSADTQTIGFLLYLRTYNAKENMAEYPLIASLSVMLTLIAIPITYLVRYLLNRFGPSED